MNPAVLIAVVLSVFSAPFVNAQNLPMLHKNDLVLFQGDSITDGGRQRTGNDYNHIMGQSYPFVIAAQVGFADPERNIQFINRGISGNRVPDLLARWQTDALALKPAMLSILIGINDTLLDKGGKESVEQFEESYDKMLAETISALPDTKIVLCEPFLLPVGLHKANYAAELTEVKKRQEVVGRLAAKYRIPVVQFQRMFDEACLHAPAEFWCWDGIHPNYAGHGLIAREWLRTVNAFWRQE